MTDSTGHALDELVDTQVALVGVTDEGLRAMAAALGGVQTIKGRDGKDAPLVYDEFTAKATDPPGMFVGSAVHGASEDAAVWFIERRPGVGIDGVVVETVIGAQDGRLVWSARESYSYVRSEAATTARRQMLKRFVRANPELAWAQWVDSYRDWAELTEVNRAALRIAVFRHPEAVDEWIDTGQMPGFHASLTTDDFRAFLAMLTPGAVRAIRASLDPVTLQSFDAIAGQETAA